MIWVDTPPVTKRMNNMPIKRTPTKGVITGIITCQKIIGTFTHFWAGKTQPCEGEECELCKRKIGNRWHGYVSAYCPKLHSHFLFEFTALAAEYFMRYQSITGRLFGCAFQASRTGTKASAPIEIKCVPQNLDGIALPDEPNIRATLAMIWGLPEGVIEDQEAYAYSSRVGPNSDLLKEMRGGKKSNHATGKDAA